VLVGTGYFDEISTLITGVSEKTAALAHSTEAEQFGPRAGKAAP
jgi:isocitrate lyase